MKRMLWIGFCILIQLIFYILLLLKFTEKFSIIHTILSILSIAIVIGLLTFSKNIESKMSWLALILAFPILGTLLYLSIGHNLYKSKILKSIKKSINKSQKYLKQDVSILEEIKEKDENIYGQVNYISKIAKYPIYKANEIKYYSTGEEAFKSMIQELKKAKKFIFMEYFIISEGKMLKSIIEILEEKVKSGVDVRVIYDDIGSATALPKNYYKQLEEKGIKCVCFNKLQPVIEVIMNNRDHRKITVIDGKVAFSGGINLADEYINEKERFGYWKDNGIMFKGEAVWNFTTTFLEIWNAYIEEKNDYTKYKNEFRQNIETNGYICPYGENPLDDENVGENIYINILNGANKYVYIFTPYLIIDTQMLSAMILAVKRGVDVRIVVPGIPDKKIVNAVTKSYYLPLIENKIKIYEYKPGFIHGKIFVSDDKIATVGSQNLDYRSLYLHFECGIYIYKSSVVQEVKNDTLDTIEKSKLITKEDLKLTIPRFLINGILRLFAGLL